MNRDISPENVRLVVEPEVQGEVMAMAVEDGTSATSATDLVTSLVNARRIRTAATVAMV